MTVKTETKPAPAIVLDLPETDAVPIAERLRDLLARGQARNAGRTFLARVEDLVDAGEDIHARIDGLAAMCRALQEAGLTDHGPALLRRRLHTFAQLLATSKVPATGGTVLIAPGAGEALALALLFHVNGRSQVQAFALTRQEDPEVVARGLFDTVAHMRLFPARYLWQRGGRPIEVLERLRGIDAAALEAGDLTRGLASFGVTLADRLPEQAMPKAALVLTTGVLNAVADPQAVLERTFAMMAPGAIAAHLIDLADPRWERGEGNFGTFSFLLSEAMPRGTNRVRAPGFTAAAAALGFTVVSDARTTRPMTDAVRARLLPQFAGLADADIAAVKQHLVLCKPTRGQS